MNEVKICSILLNDSENERQIISYDPDDKMLHSSAQDEPCCEGLQFDTVSDAIEACWSMWCTAAWSLEWEEYRVKQEYYDLWGACEGEDVVNVSEIANLAFEWEKSVEELLEQVEEIN